MERNFLEANPMLKKEFFVVENAEQNILQPKQCVRFAERKLLNKIVLLKNQNICIVEGNVKELLKESIKDKIKDEEVQKIWLGKWLSSNEMDINANFVELIESFKHTILNLLRNTLSYDMNLPMELPTVTSVIITSSIMECLIINMVDILKEISKNNYEGWGTGLKPAIELWTLARKPLSKKTVAENVLKYGTGGINIDDCRVETNDTYSYKKCGGSSFGIGNGVDGTREYPQENNPLGRFPANVIHDGSEEVLKLFPETKSGKSNNKAEIGKEGINIPFRRGNLISRHDDGSAARFFYCAKASRSERNAGLDNIVIVSIEYNIWNEKNIIQEVKKVQLLVDMGILQPKDIEEYGIQQREDLEWNTLLFGKNLMEKYLKNIKSIILMETNSTIVSQIFNWLILLLTKEYIVDVNYEKGNGGNLAVNVGSYNILTTIINEKMVSVLGVKNVKLGTQLKISVQKGNSTHPTVKPIELMKYLCKLITPENGIILDPFMGSGSTGVAAKIENFNFIGIEIDENYFKIAEARINNVKTVNNLI